MYPVCLDIKGKLSIVVGGGKVASRKIVGLLADGGKIRVISPLLSDALIELVDQGAIEWWKKNYQHGDLEGAFLVFAATDDREIQKAVLKEAKEKGLFINVVDDPENCSFQVPASVRRGDLLLTVSTNGKSPAIAAMIRNQLEKEYGVEYKILLELMTQVRNYVLAEGSSQEERKILFENVLHTDIVHWIKTGQWDSLHKHLQKVLGIDIDFGLVSPE